MNIDKYTLEELKSVLKDTPKSQPEARTVIEKAIEMKSKSAPKKVIVGMGKNNPVAIDKSKPVIAIRQDIKKTTTAKPKATAKKTTTRKKTTTTTRKKTTPEQKAQNKVKVQNATGKTIEECEKILAEYKANRMAQKEQNKDRLENLEKKGHLIEGTDEKTLEATTETVNKEVKPKIEKEVKAIVETAEKEAKKEVSEKGKTKEQVEKEVKKKAEKIITKKVDDMTKDLAKVSANYIKNIRDEIASIGDKKKAQEFLIELRGEIDVLLKAYGYGGAVQSYNVPWMGGQPTPSYAKGGKFADGGEVKVYVNDEDKNPIKGINSLSKARKWVDENKKKYEHINIEYFVNKGFGKSDFRSISIGKYDPITDVDELFKELIGRNFSKGGKFADGGTVEMFSGWQSFGGLHTRKEDAIEVVKQKRKTDIHQDWKVIEYAVTPNKYWVVYRPKKSMTANVIFADGGEVGKYNIKNQQQIEKRIDKLNNRIKLLDEKYEATKSEYLFNQIKALEKHVNLLRWVLGKDEVYEKGGKFADGGIVIRPKNASRDEIQELEYYLENNSWEVKKKKDEDSYMPMMIISTKNISRDEIQELEYYLENNSWDWKNQMSKGGKFADGGEVGDYKLEKIVMHYDGRDWMLDEYPSFIDNGDSDDWLGMSEISLERAKELAFELGGDEAIDEMEEINEAETIEELQDAISDLKYYQRDNTYNQSWWGGVIDYGVLTEDGEGYGTGLLILRMHKGGDPRGNYYDYAVYELDSFIEEFPPYYSRLTYEVTDKDGNYAFFETEDMEGYRLYVNLDNITDLEEGDSITIDELEEKFGVDVYAKGGKFADGGEIGEDEDGNKYEILSGNDKPFKSGDMAYNPMSGIVMEVYFDADDEYADDEYYVQETYAQVKKLDSTYGKGGRTTRAINQDRARLSNEKHEQAYKPKRKGKYSSFAKGGTIIKKGNRVRVVNTQFDGKEGLVVSNDLQNGNYQVQIDGKIKGFPFENLMLLSRETFAKGGSVDEVRIYVADLEAYNNGQLKGGWLDLTDYSDGSEVMEAIDELIDGEEYAIHDYEGFPSNMYSEYMGEEDFNQIIEIYNAQDEIGIPMDVILEFMSDRGLDDISTVQDAYRGEYDSFLDYAIKMVDDGIYVPSSFDIYMTDTDRRIVAGEEADYFVHNLDEEEAIDDYGDRDAYDEAEEEEDFDKMESLVDEAKEEARERVYDDNYDGLKDPVNYFVDELGTYTEEELLTQSFISVDYEKVARELEYNNSSIRSNDGQVYVFTNDYAKGGKLKKTTKLGWKRDRDMISQEPWEQAYKSKRKGSYYAKGGEVIKGFNPKDFSLEEIDRKLMRKDIFLQWLRKGDSTYSADKRDIVWENTRSSTVWNSIKDKRFTMSDYGQISMDKGSENLYFTVIIYELDGYEPMELQMYSKDNHSDLKSFANSFISKMARGGKLSKDDAIIKALKMGVDFDKDFHAQSYGNELSQLAKEVGYRKSKSSSGSLGRAFFEHLEKIYDKNSPYYKSMV